MAMSFTAYVPSELLRVLRFGIAGTAGFAADAAILVLVIQQLHGGPIEARMISAPVAILLTFVLNRIWSFTDLEQPSIARSFGSYISVQGFGLLLNLLIYSLVIAIVRSPVAALAVSSVSAMTLNYLGVRFWAFNGSRG
jgi:putative flippase GtrA